MNLLFNGIIRTIFSVFIYLMQQEFHLYLCVHVHMSILLIAIYSFNIYFHGLPWKISAQIAPVQTPYDSLLPSYN